MVKKHSKGKKGKKDGGSGGPKVKKQKPVPEGLSLNEMTRKQLLKHIKRLLPEIDREREERNFFMLEREKHFLFWNMVLEQISIEKERARLNEILYDDADRNKRSEMALYKQKLRHLQAEQAQKLGLARLVSLYKMRRVQDEMWEVLLMLREGVAERRGEWRVMQGSLYEILRSLQMAHGEEVSNLRAKFAQEIQRMSMGTERSLGKMRKELDGANKVKLAQLKTTKEDQIEHMIVNHEKQLMDMKSFFNELYTNNTEVINSLEQELVLKRDKRERLKRGLKSIVEKYEKLAGPVEDHEEKMELWAGDEAELKKVKGRMRNAERQIAQNSHYARLMDCASESILLRCSTIRKERDALKKVFRNALIGVQTKGVMTQIVGGLIPQNSNGANICPIFRNVYTRTPFNFNNCVFHQECQVAQNPECRASSYKRAADHQRYFGLAGSQVYKYDPRTICEDLGEALEPEQNFKYDYKQHYGFSKHKLPFSPIIEKE